MDFIRSEYFIIYRQSHCVQKYTTCDVHYGANVYTYLDNQHLSITHIQL